MRLSSSILQICFVSTISTLYGQVPEDSLSTVNTGMDRFFSGFIRGGFYADLKDNPGKPFISTGFSDFALKAGVKTGSNYNAHADIRMRYGSEFGEAVGTINIREAFAEYSGKSFSFSAGKRIIKWGRADFTNPTSKLNPQNFIMRSPDREDMDLGNLLGTFNFHPARSINLGVFVAPFYSPSVLIIDPVPLPQNAYIKQLNGLLTDKELFSYGIKADVSLKGIDFSFSWFEGYDPMPGIALDSLNADFTGPIPAISTWLEVKPYKTRSAGLDFETSAGPVGIRGEAAWSSPVLSGEVYEYVPLPEIRWVAGFDLNPGSWRLVFEYSGKRVISFFPSPADPLIGTEPDYAKLGELLAQPGFDLTQYVRLQTGAFNRLFNYQLERSYHLTGCRIERDLFYGMMIPSVFALYNITSRDLIVMPEIRFKPSDGMTIAAGAEIYSGSKGSLYDIVDDFMNSIFVSLRVDF